MRDFSRPNLFVSKCLTFEACRYNGQVINDDFVENLKPFVNFFPVCAEAEIGLGVPRFPIRIVNINKEDRLIQPKSGLDVTDKMNSFAESFLASLKDIDGFILKERSPSCGMKGVKVYLENGNVKSGKGVGLFAAKAIDKFGELPYDDEGRLRNFQIRSHFLAAIFMLADFRKVKASLSAKELTEFHARNKFALMAGNQKEMRLLGKIAANLEKRELSLVLDEYEKHLRLALKTVPTRKANINVLEHIFGFFSKGLNSREKDFFFESLDLYREERIPFISVVNMLHSWVMRENNEYLANQSIFNPFPKALLELSDSGKHLDL